MNSLVPGNSSYQDGSWNSNSNNNNNSNTYVNASNESASAQRTTALFFDVTDQVVSEADRKITVIISRGVSVKHLGDQQYRLTPEMLHYDDFMASKENVTATLGSSSINNRPSMKTLFGGSQIDLSLPPFIGDGKLVYQPRSIVMQEHLMSSPQQRFCSEMLHWDEYRRGLALQQGQREEVKPCMTQMFFAPGPVEVSVLRVSPAGKVVLSTSVHYVLAMRELEADHPRQCFCTEMLHYDELIETTPSLSQKTKMISLFGGRKN